MDITRPISGTRHSQKGDLNVAQKRKIELSRDTLVQVAAYAGLPLRSEQVEQQRAQLGDMLEQLASIGEEALKDVEPAYVGPMRREKRSRR